MSNDEQYLVEHFPSVDCKARPCGNQILVQLRTTKSKTAGGIYIPNETKQFNDGNTQIGKLVKIGPIAFHDRSSGDKWKEGAWADVGEVVVMPKWGGFRVETPIPESEDKAIFCLYNDYDVKMVVEGDYSTFDQLV